MSSHDIVKASAADRIVQVQSAADPPVDLLLAARSVVQCQSPEVQALYQGSLDTLADRLIEYLTAKLETADVEGIRQVALYLSDEYRQAGKGCLLVSSVTGRALARITDADLWQPPAQPREGGGLATPLKRLNPALESALIQWVFDTEREKKLVQALTSKLPDTSIIPLEQDPRLAVITRKGRRHVENVLREALPTLLPDCAGGSARTFLSIVQPQAYAPPGTQTSKRLTAVVHDTRSIVDLKATNLQYATRIVLCTKMAVGWTREIARHLVDAAIQFKGKPSTIGLEEWKRSLDGFFWIVPPNVARQQTACAMLVVESTPAVLGLPWDLSAGVLLHADSFDLSGQELFERWDVQTSFDFTVWADWSRVVVVDVVGVPVSGVTVETV